MTAIVVCPLSRLAETLRASGAGWAVSLHGAARAPAALSAIPESRRLHLDLSDITAPMPGHRLAERSHVDSLLRFVTRWDRRTPLLIHCYAGVSRSPAAAFVTLCLVEPFTPEDTHARRLRAASPSATPNLHLVALADAALNRGGRMTAAIAAIGRGRDCFEGECFSLPLAAEPPRVDGLARMPA